MATTGPANSARDLVLRARGIAVRHQVLRSLLRGAAAGALLAAVLAVGARLVGVPVGPWLSVALLPALALAAIGLRRARMTFTSAALLLDRAAGTRERFLAAVTATNPEVRELAAKQALRSPEFEDGAFPLRFPPSADGLAAAVAGAILLGVLLLPGGEPPGPGTTGGGRPLPAMPGSPGVPPEDARRTELPAGAGASLPPEVDEVTQRMAAGEELDAEDWKTLEAAGLAREVRGEVAAALENGDPALAARAVRRALEKLRSAGSPTPAAAAPGDDWDAYRQALESPGWSPRYDDVVRRYFTGAEEAGLR